MHIILNKCRLAASVMLLAVSLTHGVIAQTYTMTDLGVLPGGNWSHATAINNKGDVIGYSNGSPGTEGGIHGFSYHDGIMTDLGTYGDADKAHIDDSGRITGWSHTAPNVNFERFHPEPPPGGSQTIWAGTDSSGVIYGSFLNAHNQWHAYVIKKGHPIDIGTLPGFQGSGVIAFHANGTVLCDAHTGNGKPYHEIPFLWHDGKVTLLTGLPVRGSVTAKALNRDNAVVGYYESYNPYQLRAFLHTGKKFLDLNTCLPAGSGWRLESADGINDAGQIVGTGWHGDAPHGYLLTPSTKTPPAIGKQTM